MKLHFTKTTEKFTVRLNVEPDCMKLFIDVEPVAKQVITRDDLLEAIKESVDTAKVDLRVLDDVVAHLKGGEVVEDRRIMKGTPPVNGADGKLVLLKKKYDGGIEVAVDQRGFADFKELHLYDNIAKGETIGKIHPPEKGQDGVDVFNTVVPGKEGQPAKVVVDRSISIKSAPDPKHEYQILEAENDGYLAEDGGKFSIKGELVISGDLDLRFGSLDFIGNVKVTGDVTQGLSIKAKQGIVVQGSLKGATLISSDGDINVKGFYYGGPDSRVEGSKLFNATVIHSVNAEIGGDIVISKEALDCSLRTHASILMLKGRLIGGEASVTKGLEAKFIGNEASQKTIIRLCSDVEITTEFVKLQKHIESHEKAIKLLALRLGPFALDPKRLDLLDPAQRALMEEFLAKLKAVEGSKGKLFEQRGGMLENAKKNDVMRVNFLSKMYRGVVVMADDVVFAPPDDLSGPASLDYIVASKSFELGELKPLAT